MIENTNTLVVGAGGIGCELLKNLVISGFKKISIVDLDKIEKSNLNRQFLYNSECLGKFKADMAKKAIEKFKKNLELKAYVGDITDIKLFNNEFFSQFDIILNALDNIKARTYINKICIDNNIPLVNSGTEGYIGVVGCHIRNETSCYNCIPRSNNKKIPICSIRSKPEKIEHCVAWAKSLFELLFCNKKEDNYLEDYNLSLDHYKNFKILFNEDIINIEKARVIELFEVINLDYENFNHNIHIYDDKTDMNLEFFISLFFKSVEILKTYEKFDKDDKDIVNFVFSCSNLRAYNFSINYESRFKIKEIAGNIVPAIASTNAIIAGIQTIEAIKIITKDKDNLRNVSLNKEKKIISNLSVNEDKNIECIICSEMRSIINLKMDFNIFTLGSFVKILEEKFFLKNFQISLNKNLLFEKGDLDDEDEDIYNKLLGNNFSHFEKANICRISVSSDNRKLEFIAKDEKILDYIIEIISEETENKFKKNEDVYKNVEILDLVESDSEDIIENVKFIGIKRKLNTLEDDLPKKIKLL